MSSSPDSSATSSPVKHKQTEDLLLSLFEPIVFDLDEHVQQVSASQNTLHRELDELMSNIESIKSNPDLTLVLEEKSKKLVNLKRRLTLVHTIVQNANERCRKLMIANRIAERKIYMNMDIKLTSPLKTTLSNKRKLFECHDNDDAQCEIDITPNHECIQDCLKELINKISFEIDGSLNELSVVRQENVSSNGHLDGDCDDDEFDAFDESWLSLSSQISQGGKENAKMEVMGVKPSQENVNECASSNTTSPTHKSLNMPSLPLDATQRASYILAQLDRINENVTQFRRQLALNRQSNQHK